MSSLVRRNLVANRALASRDAVQAPRVVTFDADTAVMLAVSSTRGMLDACLRDHAGQRQHVEVTATPAAPSPPSVPEPEAETCPRWRASQVRRAYLSTLPPPPDQPAPGGSCKRRA